MTPETFIHFFIVIVLLLGIYRAVWVKSVRHVPVDPCKDLREENERLKRSLVELSAEVERLRRSEADAKFQLSKAHERLDKIFIE